MDGRRRSSARLLAPIALVLFAFAFFLVIVSSDTSEDSDNGRDRAGQRTNTGTETTTGTDGEPRPSARFYTVKTGDTLAAIAETVGVPVDTLLELNPDLDPQALVSGQKIRLRE